MPMLVPFPAVPTSSGPTASLAAPAPTQNKTVSQAKAEKRRRARKRKKEKQMEERKNEVIVEKAPKLEIPSNPPPLPASQ